MKQIILSLILATVCFAFAKADVVINATNFPNLNFRVWIVHNVDIVNDGVLTDMEIANITEIDTYTMNFNNISDITGIEFLTDLERLNITNTTESQRVCSITNVDLSQNKKLKHFTFSRASSAAPALLSLNISNLPELETISITQAGITELDCSGCSKLKSLSVPNGMLTSITLNGCTSLETLDCSNNQFSALHLNDLPNLVSLNFTKNNLTSLSLNGCNELTSLECSNGILTEINVANCEKLSNLNCSHTKIKTLDCSLLPSLKSVNFSHCSQLEEFPILPSGIKAIHCSNSPIIAKSDLSQFPNLTQLYADSCELEDFDITKCPNIQALSLKDNHIMALELFSTKRLSSDSNLEQNIKVPAKYHPDLRQWEITMPETFDPSRIHTYYGNEIRLNEWVNATAKVETSTFIDHEGRERFSFFITQMYGDVRVHKGAFCYVYTTNNYYNHYIYSAVQVYCWEVTSGVEDVSTSKVVSGVRYYDLQGHESAEPFNGFNVEVTHYTDGTTQSKKFIR